MMLMLFLMLHYDAHRAVVVMVKLIKRMRALAHCLIKEIMVLMMLKEMLIRAAWLVNK